MRHMPSENYTKCCNAQKVRAKLCVCQSYNPTGECLAGWSGSKNDCWKYFMQIIQLQQSDSEQFVLLFSVPSGQNRGLNRESCYF